MQGLGNGTATLGAGYGFGGNDFRLLGGLALPNSKLKDVKGGDTGTDFALSFVRASLLAQERWHIEPFIATNFGDIYQLSVQTSYRLPGKSR
ncbi:hypothetical protein LGH70_15270 [Hymenobacter sp. BT635]|uniref:Uncharacterized protein n=1 Tax=Hymenobacter nitidus TaxID=2880929 RepID=A0ABS8AEX3_9BACT|nr:hypothetical protein [Hymenobacter nitidus]MCB2378960.1 hypothetical protein [Hymenobacter nitidus]